MAEQVDFNFSGAVYDKDRDKDRLIKQMQAIRDFMVGTACWWTVQELESQLTSMHNMPFPQNSIQAQIRNLKKPEGGAYIVEKRRRKNQQGEETNLWEFRMSNPDPNAPPPKAKAPTKKEKGIVLEELLQLLEGKSPSDEMMKLLRWLTDGSA